MTNVKLYHNSISNKETLIATFKNLNEAMQCRDLLQAKCSDQDNSYYFIEFKEKGINKRKQSDTFHQQVLYMHQSVKQNIKLMLS